MDTLKVLKSLPPGMIKSLGTLDQSIISRSMAGNAKAQEMGGLVLKQLTQLLSSSPAVKKAALGKPSSYARDNVPSLLSLPIEDPSSMTHEESRPFDRSRGQRMERNRWKGEVHEERWERKRDVEWDDRWNERWDERRNERWDDRQPLSDTEARQLTSEPSFGGYQVPALLPTPPEDFHERRPLRVGFESSSVLPGGRTLLPIPVERRSGLLPNPYDRHFDSLPSAGGYGNESPPMRRW